MNAVSGRTFLYRHLCCALPFCVLMPVLQNVPPHVVRSCTAAVHSGCVSLHSCRASVRTCRQNGVFVAHDIKKQSPTAVKLLPGSAVVSSGTLPLCPYSASGIISLYPLPWMLMISMFSSALRCLRSFVIYTSILLALK